MGELKPCPFCGATPPNIVVEYVVPPDDGPYVECLSCGATGPDGGVDAWNARAEEPWREGPPSEDGPSLVKLRIDGRKAREE